MNQKRKISVKHRDDQYAEKYRTSVWLEQPSPENPFVETDASCYGYPLEELANNVDFAQMLFLMLKGELPSEPQKRFFNKLLVAFSHPGIRHDATRASILAGVGKTIPENVLPAAMLVFGGERTAAGGLDRTMKFISKSRRKDPVVILERASALPGFGCYYGSCDAMAKKMANWLVAEEYETPHLEWALKMAAALEEKSAPQSILKAGVVAAAFCDLGIMPKFAVGLYQLVVAPGLLAQGFEHANKAPTVLPFVGDEDYQLKTMEAADE